jgi:hypothetical protein
MAETDGMDGCIESQAMKFLSKTKRRIKKPQKSFRFKRLALQDFSLRSE